MDSRRDKKPENLDGENQTQAEKFLQLLSVLDGSLHNRNADQKKFYESYLEVLTCASQIFHSEEHLSVTLEQAGRRQRIECYRIFGEQLDRLCEPCCRQKAPAVQSMLIFLRDWFRERQELLSGEEFRILCWDE